MHTVWLRYIGLCIVLHLYLVHALRLAYPGVEELAWGVMGPCAIMLALPFVARRLEDAGHYHEARGVAAVNAPYMVMLTWFCALALGMEGWNLALGRWGGEGGLRWALPPGRTLGVIALLVCVAALWSVYEAGRVKLKRVTFHSVRVRRTVRILQISDLHLGLLTRRRALRRVLRLMESSHADLIVSTGDLVDGALEHLEPLAAEMARIRPRLGKFAVLGNHEFYAGIVDSLRFLEASGFRVIRGECVRLPEGLRLVGVDDPTGHRFDGASRSDESAALPPRSRRQVTILLKHRPTINESAVGRFDLQLSGHTHGGQISTDKLVNVAYPLRTGLRHIDEETASYVSRGSGTWGAPMRLFSPPEVTLILLEPGSRRPLRLRRRWVARGGLIRRLRARMQRRR